MANRGPILLFDGVCNLCNSSVKFVLKHEVAPVLRFGYLQSEEAKVLLEDSKVDPSELSSMVFVHNGRVLSQSAAAFELAKYLKAPWSWGRGFSILPKFLTDFGYDIIAKYRYAWFGKSNQCLAPSEAVKKRFIDYSEKEIVAVP